MDKLNIYLRFLSLSGLSEGEGGRYRFLCDDAFDYFKLMAESNEALEEYGSAFDRAAAALAWLNYSTLQSADGAKSFQAGDLSVELSASGVDTESARSYYLECLEPLRDRLKDGDFFFKAV